MKRLTIHDVAQAAGVSHMTVSRVVRGVRSVAAGTEQKVRAAIEAIGYSPDPALSALAAYRTNARSPGEHGVLAFLDCDQTEFSRQVMRGAVDEGRLLGYTIERFPMHQARAAQVRLSRMLFHRGVHGLLFGPSDEAWTFSGWPWEEFAPVSLGALSHQPRMHKVAIDYFHSAFTACEILWQKGCRRIGFAVDPALDSRTEHRWLGGYLAVLATKSVPPLCYSGTTSKPHAFKSWARRNKIDGLLTIHAGLSGELPATKTVFLNDIEAPADLPCFQLPPASIGAEGVRLLHHLLLRREFGLPAQPKMSALQGLWREPGIGWVSRRHSRDLPLEAE